MYSTRLILSKNDAKKLAYGIKEDHSSDGFTFGMEQGRHRIFYENSVFSWYSWGQNWSDQAPTEIGNLEDVINFIWRYRKYINNEIREELAQIL